MNAEFREIECFVAVADELNFSRAAKRLNTVPSAVSQTIARLEERFGFPLFARDNRRVALSAEGALLILEARRVVGSSRDFSRFATRIATGHVDASSRPVRIGIVSTALVGLLPSALTHPQTRGMMVLPTIMTEFEQRQALADGRIDLGVMRARPDPAQRYSLRILDEELVVVCRADSTVARLPAVEVGDLEHEVLLLYPRTLAPTAFDAVAAVFERDGHPIGAVHEVPNDETLLGLVACGVGVSIVPASLTRLQLSEVAYRPLADPLATTPLAIHWAGEELLPTARRIAAALRDAGQRTGEWASMAKSA